MPSLERKPGDTGVLIRTKTNQLFWYARNETVDDRQTGDVWAYLPYDQTSMFYTFSRANHWANTRYQNLPSKVKTILSLIF